jgi:hypothetical protein
MSGEPRREAGIYPFQVTISSIWRYSGSPTAPPDLPGKWP